MEQLSRPYQIALGAIVVFVLLWFVVLKPGGGGEATPTPAASTPASPAPTAASSQPAAPGVAGLTRAVGKAQGAVEQSDASAQRTEQAAGAAGGSTSGSGPAPSSSATSRAASAQATAPTADGGLEPDDASRPILDDVRAGKLAVVLFYNPLGADDQAVRRALKRVDRFKGKVRVRQIPIARVADYPAITQGVPVGEAPTLLVFGRSERARRLVGYQDTRSIEQLIGDVGGRAFRPGAQAGYRAKVETLCETAAAGTTAALQGGSSFAQAADADRREFADALRTARGLEVPRGFSAFQSRLEELLRANLALYQGVVRAEKRDGTGRVRLQRTLAPVTAKGVALQRLARKRGIRGC